MLRKLENLIFRLGEMISVESRENDVQALKQTYISLMEREKNSECNVAVSLVPVTSKYVSLLVKGVVYKHLEREIMSPWHLCAKNKSCQSGHTPLLASTFHILSSLMRDMKGAWCIWTSAKYLTRSFLISHWKRWRDAASATKYPQKGAR